MGKVIFAGVTYFGVDDTGKVHPKRIDEDWNVVFDFTKRLASGETLSSATWTATVHAGTDASPNDIISGAASQSGALSTQKVIDGLEGVTYLLQCEATTSAPQVLHGIGLLKVSDEVR